GLLPHLLPEGVQVAGIIVELLDVGAPTVGLAVAAVVERHHPEALLGEVADDALVAAAVVGIAVDHAHPRLRRVRDVAGPEEAEVVASGEEPLVVSDAHPAGTLAGRGPR